MERRFERTDVLASRKSQSLALSCCVLLFAIMCLFMMGCGKEDGRYVGSVYYPVNEQGQTYGSSALAYENLPEGTVSKDVIDYMPDLVSVVGEDGTEGYILKEDFLPPSTPSSPEEALQMQSDGAYDEKEVPLYASDGKTVLGTYSNGY